MNLHSNAWYEIDGEEYCVFWDGPPFALEPNELLKENNYGNLWGGFNAELATEEEFQSVLGDGCDASRRCGGARSSPGRRRFPLARYRGYPREAAAVRPPKWNRGCGGVPSSRKRRLLIFCCTRPFAKTPKKQSLALHHSFSRYPSWSITWGIFELRARNQTSELYIC